MQTLLVSLTAMVIGASEPSKAEPGYDPATIQKIAIDPEQISLDDPRSMQRVLVSGWIGERVIDLTDKVELQIADESIAKLNDRFEIVPVADGETTLLAKLDKYPVSVPVVVRNMNAGRRINFPNEIVPIFTKLTCNSGGCHGKSGGQNGFRLSLLGFEPQEDHEYVVREGRGRRIFPAAPEQSLLLRKASGGLPHGGGKWMKPGDDNYNLIVAWIQQGAPYGTDKDPVVTSIEVFPNRRVMARGSTQYLRVTATYSDGRTEDVTRHVQFQSNDEAVASVNELGKVTTHDLSGESAVMARYMGKVAVFRATVPVGLEIDTPVAFEPRNFIDELTQAKWKDLGLVPSPTASDAQFIRRVSIDICGKLPDSQSVHEFIESNDPNKREKLIDRLLNSADYASYMAMKWGAVLQNRRDNKREFAYGTHAMSLWLKQAFYDDMPYDEFVTAILTASGTPDVNPPTVWYRSVRTPEDNVDNVSQLFLGTRIQCARCHHHPFEKWGQDDYYSMAAFFNRLGRKPFETFVGSTQVNEAVFVNRSGATKHPKTGQVMPAAGLDAEPVEIAPGEDPRYHLAKWMTKPDNPFFARALVNRLWGHFFSRGIVEPIDDMRVTNPPTNPELLDALAEDFVRSGYSIKHTIKMICSSATYQLDSEPNKYNLHDKQNFARYYPKRLQAEVLLDALDQVTQVRTNFNYPQEMRAVDLPDEQVNSYFLDIFGRPQRSSSCECERSVEANLSQALHLLNSNEVQSKLTADQGRAAQLASDSRPEEEKIKELFLTFFSRLPRAEEVQTAVEYISGQSDKKVAYQNIIWALINTKEFQFNT